MSPGRVNEMRSEPFLAKYAAKKKSTKRRADLLDLSQVKGQATPSESLS